MARALLRGLHGRPGVPRAEPAVTADGIKAFAREFDPQPFHLDEAAAAASFFGGLAASGWHTAALTMRLLVETAADRRRPDRRRRRDRLAAPDPARATC